MTHLIIARHGNTFEDHETPRRVGARTDLSLTAKGQDQAKSLGVYLKNNRLIPDVVYSSSLARTIQTANIAIKEMGFSNPVYALDIFNEIDYGPDENKTEEEVIARIGNQALKEWEEEAIVPQGWQADAQQIIQNWQNFAQQIRMHEDGETILVVTSNGIARFAPFITGDFEGFKSRYGLKLSTGAIGILEYANNRWTVKDWNIKP